MPTPMNTMTLLLTAADPPIARTPGGSRRADAALMDAFLRKDPDAGRRLYDRFAPRIYGVGLFLLRNRSDAQDLVQDTFVRLWRTSATFDPDRGSLETWILMHARSIAIDLLRRRSLESRHLAANGAASEASDEPGPERYAEVADLVRRATVAMADLPVAQRSVLELTYFGERSTKEVADLLRIPRGTVKSRRSAGMARLQRAFQGDDDDAA
jgi:RNA polymerase sigma-70 factor, ECF subfamily